MNENILIDEKERDRTDIIKGDVVDWRGGKKIVLDKVLKSTGKSVKDSLTDHLKVTIDKELKNHEGIVRKIKRCQKIYSGKKDKKSYPWVGAANVSIPIARSDADAIIVRIEDAIFNKKKLVLFTPKNNMITDEEEALLKQQEDAFNHYLLNTLNLKDKTKSIFQQTVVSGTGIGKIRYEVKNHPFYDYAQESEVQDKKIKKYKMDQSPSLLVKRPSITFKGPNFYQVARENFLISSDALSVDTAYFCADRFYRRKQELKSMATRNLYFPDSVERLTKDEFTQTQKDRAKDSGLAMDKTVYEEPYELWECWFKFDVDGDGDEDDIVCVYHRASNQILSAIYNPIFYNYRPYVAFKGWPIAYTFDGQGICERLESINQEVDTIHNQRLDRMHLLNMPIGFYRSGVGIEDFKLTPGLFKPVDVDPQTVFYVVPMPDIYPSTEREEARLVEYADRDAGVTPAAMGVSTAERPVAKDTAVLAEEANKKFSWWTDNSRFGLSETCYKLLEAFAQYHPTYEYVDEGGQQQSVPMPRGNIRDYINLDLQISTEIMNMETRREVELMKFQLVKSYSDSTMALAQALTTPNVPSEFKKYIIASFDVWNRLMRGVLENFDEKDPAKQIVDIKKSMDLNKCVMQSADLLQEAQAAQMQAQQQAQQQGQVSPGGQPAGPGLPQMALGGPPQAGEMPLGGQ
jgi:hypothetical protein